MAALQGTKTHDNLKAAFAGESQANRRYLYFAKRADIEGYPEVARLFRDRPRVRRAMPTDIWITSNRSEILPLACPSQR